MKKILNWTCGSFFRTIGRILCYIAMGYILFQLLDNEKVKNIIPDLLGFTVVKADTTGSWTSATYEVRQCEVARDPETMNYYYTNCQSDSADYEESMNFGSSNGHLTRYQWLVNNNTDSGWDVGTWDITIVTWINPLVPSELVDYNYRFYANTRATSNGAVEGYNNNLINSYVCQQWTDTSQGNLYVRCKFTNRVPIKFFMIEMYLPDEQIAVSNTSQIYWWGIQNFTGNTDATSAVNAQTEVIQEEFDQTRQAIIDNNNQNTQAIINANKSCGNIPVSAYTFPGSLQSNGNVSSPNNNFAVTDFIKLNKGDSLTLIERVDTGNSYICFYDENKDVISCISQLNLLRGQSVDIPSNAGYFRATLKLAIGRPIWSHCQNTINSINDSINDVSTTDAINDGSSFFNNFTTNQHGLTGIVTAPLTAIQSLTSATCSPLVLPLPFVNQDLTLPCMRPIYQSTFGGFMTLYDIITLGIVSYWIMVRIFSLVKDFKNPDHDEIEVVDL